MGTEFHGHKTIRFEYYEEYTFFLILLLDKKITKNNSSLLKIPKMYALRSCPSNAPMMVLSTSNMLCNSNFSFMAKLDVFAHHNGSCLIISCKFLKDENLSINQVGKAVHSM